MDDVSEVIQSLSNINDSLILINCYLCVFLGVVLWYIFQSSISGR